MTNLCRHHACIWIFIRVPHNCGWRLCTCGRQPASDLTSQMQISLDNMEKQVTCRPALQICSDSNLQAIAAPPAVKIHSKEWLCYVNLKMAYSRFGGPPRREGV